jgi:MoxR-like ATPase
MTVRESIMQLGEHMQGAIIGQESVIERLIIGLLANGNLLLEGLPGLAKTRAVKALARNLAADLNRIQFTPDLLPSDITGTEVYHQVNGKGEFRFEPGPLFANLVLADEINRAPAKVQAALLEAMEERQVTVAGATHRMPDLFMVLATQNPVEQEGTYPLPEAQMDRFLMHVLIDYPDEAAEGDIIRLVRGETASIAAGAGPEPIAQEVVFAARAEIDEVTGGPEPPSATSSTLVCGDPRPGPLLRQAGELDPRRRESRAAAIALDKTARVHAWMAGRDHVTPDDIRAVVHDCLRHRLMLSYEAHAAGLSAQDVVTEIVTHVAVA